MSTPAASGAGGDGQKPGGLSRFMKRASSVLKRDRTKRQSVSKTTALEPVQDPAVSTSTPAPATSSAPGVTAPTTSQTAPPVPSKDDVEDQKPETKPKPPMTAAENNKLLEDKARALFAKYNMTLETGEWTPPFKNDSIRVEKKVRVRIHRHCHRCQTMFGAEKICAECGHTRCKKCPRSKMTGLKERKGKSALAGSLVVDDRYLSAIGSEALNMPYRRTGKELGGSGRIKCHKCQTAFGENAIQCEACGHQRCAQCPQDSISSTVPEGSVPRRRQLQPLRVRVRWVCHECQKTFKDLETKCSKCGHGKCDSCTRDPAVEEKPPEDPEALRSAEERLQNLEVSPQASAA